MQPFGRNRYGPKIGGCAPLGGRAGFPSNTMWSGPSPTYVPSLISIRPTVWQQCTNVTDRQTGQDRQDRTRSANRFTKGRVKRFALCYPSVVCLSCPVLSCLSSLSVTFVHCTRGQTVGQINTKLSMQVGLGPGHIVLGGDPAPKPLKGHSRPIFGPYLLRPNGCMDQNATWY